MNKFSALSAVIISIGLLLAGYFIGDMQRKSKAFDRYVTVKGLAERSVNANIGIWSQELNLADNNLTTLMSRLESQKQQVVSFYKKIGFTSDEILIGLANTNDASTDRYSNQNERQFRFFGKLDLTLRTSDISKLQTALKLTPDLLQSGVLLASKDTWNPVQYVYTGLNEIKPEMIEEATKNAKMVAERFAQDSDSKVGKIRTANQGQFSIYNEEGGKPEMKKVRVVSTITYYLKD